MPDKIQCHTHGECFATFVCTHLQSESAGLGFNRNEPIKDDRFPDAWCDNCEIIRAAHDGWDEESEKLAQIVMICSGCYERARIRNTKPSVTLDDLADLRWKCGACEEWHTGPCLDFGVDSPYYWSEEHQKASHCFSLLPSWSKKHKKTFLGEDYCAIEDRDFFVRGIIHLPIIGAAETFRWGVWGSLSRDNFEKLRETNEDPKRVDLPPMFSWLSTQIPALGLIHGRLVVLQNVISKARKRAPRSHQRASSPERPFAWTSLLKRKVPRPYSGAEDSAPSLTGARDDDLL